MKDKRSVLADYLDQRVTAVGFFDMADNYKRPSGGWIRWSLLQDVRVEVDGKQLDIGHIRVQHAAALDEHHLLPGDKVKFTGRVTLYYRRSTGMQSYNLSHPDDIEVIERAPFPQPHVAGAVPRRAGPTKAVNAAGSAMSDLLK